MNLSEGLNNPDGKARIAVEKNAMEYLRSFFDSILDIFFPSLCIKCGECVNGRETICLPCLESIPINKSLFCGSCGARLPYGKKVCHFDFPYILGAATTYKNETARDLVRELKFGFIKNTANPLAKLLIAYVENMGFAENDWIVVPVPLGTKRLRKRGFNQAALIAEIFAGRFSLAVEKEGFIRRKETMPQSEMKNFESRLKNTKGCFEVTAQENFSGRNIILIDDVSTSGATFFEAAKALSAKGGSASGGKKSGAKKIIALAAVKG